MFALCLGARGGGRAGGVGTACTGVSAPGVRGAVRVPVPFTRASRGGAPARTCTVYAKFVEEQFV